MNRRSRQQVEQEIRDQYDMSCEIYDDYGNPHNYLIMAWPAGHGLRLGRKLTKLLGSSGAKALVALANADWDALIEGEGTVEMADINLGAVSEAFVLVCDTLEEYGDEQIFKAILKGASRDEMDCVIGFDQIYKANYGEMFRATLKCIQVSYGPLFAGRAGAVAEFLKSRFQTNLSAVSPDSPVSQASNPSSPSAH